MTFFFYTVGSTWFGSFDFFYLILPRFSILYFAVFLRKSPVFCISFPFSVLFFSFFSFLFCFFSRLYLQFKFKRINTVCVLLLWSVFFLIIFLQKLMALEISATIYLTTLGPKAFSLHLHCCRRRRGRLHCWELGRLRGSLLWWFLGLRRCCRGVEIHAS